MSVAITVETPLQDAVRTMVAALNDYLMPLSPPEFQFQLTAEQMAEPTVTVFVARAADGHPVGMASLKDHGDGLGASTADRKSAAGYARQMGTGWENNRL